MYLYINQINKFTALHCALQLSKFQRTVRGEKKVYQTVNNISG